MSDGPTLDIPALVAEFKDTEDFDGRVHLRRYVAEFATEDQWLEFLLATRGVR